MQQNRIILAESQYAEYLDTFAKPFSYFHDKINDNI